MKKTITICASGSHYKQVVDVKNKLKELGFKVFIPATAGDMEKKGNYDISKYKTWYKDPKKYHEKTAKMKGHLKLIDKGDAILVTNFTKRRQKGYVGSNVLLEIFYAWLKEKPIYILNPLSKKSTIIEEILGMSPVFIDGDLKKIR